MDEKEFMILSSLRHNGREKLTSISRNTSIPVSTIFENLRNFEKNSVIKRHSCLLNFSKLGYEIDAGILIKVDRGEREKLREFLLDKPCLNSIYKISNSYDFMVEGIFRDMLELQDFLDELEDKFNLIRNDVYHIVSDIRREEFLNGIKDQEEE
ncbi:Lrp/AsnC family transcriptional regulator [Candidatus Woesearchaeota archaeon]|nr:Lrp/AsnC family transcriptional regulator [Candidatus Woesearchaeota archaeon]